MYGSAFFVAENERKQIFLKDNIFQQIVAFKYSIPILLFLQQKQKNCEKLPFFLLSTYILCLRSIIKSRKFYNGSILFLEADMQANIV